MLYGVNRAQLTAFSRFATMPAPTAIYIEPEGNAMAEPLTDRQREIKMRLDQGMGAREIGDDLGISRNAVYQQMQRMRKHGNLPPQFTPSGQPPREPRPGEDVLRRLVPTLHETEEGTIEQVAGVAAIIGELRRTRDDLDAISRRLSYIVPR